MPSKPCAVKPDEMIEKISWRNIWRNRTRSMVIISSVALGLWGGIYIMALSKGVSFQRKDEVIKSHLSHIQIHEPEFKVDKDIGFTVSNGLEILTAIRSDERVSQAAARSLTYGMASSPAGGAGVMINGVIPGYESQLTGFKEKIIEGSYFEEDYKNQIVIGQKLAEKLNLKLRSKMVLTFQDSSNEIIAAAFRVVGIFRTVASKYDESNIIIRADDIKKMLGQNTMPVHEIALLLHDMDEVDSFKQDLEKEYPDLLVESWKQLSPEMQYVDEILDYFLYIFIGVILLALAFGLINTMLMAVLERVRELGMLMAVGMNKLRVFSMIMLETVYLTLCGGIIGMSLGWVSVRLTGNTGLNFSALEEGFSGYGMEPVIYPLLENYYYPVIGFMVVSFAILSAIYPAIKALKLKPVQAIRKI